MLLQKQNTVSEGMVAILEPFIDTIVICSITGLTLLLRCLDENIKMISAILIWS